MVCTKGNKDVSGQRRRKGLSVLEILLVGVITVMGIVAVRSCLKSQPGEAQIAGETPPGGFEEEPDRQSFSDADPLDGRGHDWRSDWGTGASDGDDGIDMDSAAYRSTGSSASTVTISANVKAMLEEAVVFGKVDWGRLNQKIKELPAESMAEAWAFIDALPWDPAKQEALQALMEDWGATNPLNALDFALALGSRRQRAAALMAITEGWVQSDPESAFAWYSKQAADPDTPMPPLRIDTLFEGMYRHSKEWALEEVWNLPTAALQQRALLAMLHDDDGHVQTRDRMLEYFNQLDDPDKQALLIPSLAGSWATFDPSGAATWVSEHEDEDLRRQASAEVVRHWARLDPEESMEWLLGQDDEALQRRSAYEIGRNWTADNPTEFMQWVEDSEPSAARDSAVAGGVRTLSYRRPEQAIKMAGSISAEGQRHKVTEAIIKSWYPRNKSAAIVAALESDLPDKVKRRYAKAGLPRAKPKPKPAR